MERFPALTRLDVNAVKHPSSRGKTVYIRAVHKESGIELLWIEDDYLFKRCAYPCVVKLPDKLMVYWVHQKGWNDELIRWWRGLTPTAIAESYSITQMEKRDFFNLFDQFKDTAVAELKEYDDS